MPDLSLFRTLNTRILTIFLGISVLPVGLLGIWTYRHTLDTLHEERIERLSGLRDAKKREMEQFFQERLGDLTVLSVNEQTIRALETPVNTSDDGVDNKNDSPQESLDRFSWLEKYKLTYRYHDIILARNAGDILFSTSETITPSDNLLHGVMAESLLGRTFAATRKGVVLLDSSPLYRSEEKLTASLGTPVYQNDQMVGAIILQIGSVVIDELLQQSSEIQKNGEIFLVGRNAGGSVLRSKRRPGLGRAGDPFTFPELETAFSGSHGVVKRLERDGEPVLSAFAPLAIPGLNWAIVTQFPLEQVETPVREWAGQFAAMAAVLFMVAAWFSWLLARNLVAPITALVHASSEIATGKWSARVAMARVDEIGHLGEAFNTMANYIEEQNWLKSRAGMLRDLFGKATNEETLCREVITELATHMKAGQGAIYLLNDADGRYHLTGSFAYQKRKHFSHAFAPGEYLIGQCAQENQIFIHTHLPPDYTEIGSGLGKAVPINLILAPVAAGEKVVGVIEMASFQVFTPAHIGLLENIAPSLGLTLEKMRQSQRTAALLQEVQRQADELTAQQTELLQINTTLEQQGRDLAASEEEMRAQNELLEEKTRDLELANTDLKAKQEALQKVSTALTDKASELAIASRYKSEFLANMSHELRTPLNSILIIADNLMDNRGKNLTDDQITAARILRESGQDLLQLINGILDLAKIEAGKMELQIQEVNLTALLEDVRLGFLPVAAQKRLTFVVERDPSVPEKLLLDPNRVQQVLRNFLANAFKFTKQGGVTLRVTRTTTMPAGCLTPSPTTGKENLLSEEGFLTLAVMDTGIGVKEEKRTLIFDSFQQADGGIDRQFGGTGLGLSISKTLAELMHGTLCLASTPDQGSTFTLLLPWSQVTKPETNKNHPLTATPMENPLLLIIEDDPVFAAFVGKIATERGFAVHHEESGAGGLAAIARMPPRGVILDLNLPDMDGWSLLDNLQNHPEHRKIPVHVISAEDPGVDLRQTGLTGFVTKPVSQAKMHEVLDRLLTTPISQPPPRVLVIDPDQSFQAQMRKLAHDLPVTVDYANTHAEAKNALHARRYDCIILDPDFPEGRVEEIMHMLAEHHRHNETEIIFCSTHEMSREEHNRLLPFTSRFLLKKGSGDRRMMDEIALFLHSIEMGTQRRPKPHPILHGDEFFQGKRVLVVDDDMRNTFVLTSTLELRGMRVFMATDGEMALTMLDQHQETDIVLMDVMMPGMDGLSTIRQIRTQERFREIPIIALTAKAMLGDREKALEAGANDYLAKPVDLVRLFSMMRVWLYPQGDG